MRVAASDCTCQRETCARPDLQHHPSVRGRLAMAAPPSRWSDVLARRCARPTYTHLTSPGGGLDPDRWYIETVLTDMACQGRSRPVLPHRTLLHTAMYGRRQGVPRRLQASATFPAAWHRGWQGAAGLCAPSPDRREGQCCHPREDDTFVRRAPCSSLSVRRIVRRSGVQPCPHARAGACTRRAAWAG